MLIIQANNIHEGGSKALLISFLNNVAAKKKFSKIYIFLDTRFDIKNISESALRDMVVVWVKPSLFTRLISEIKISYFSYKFKNSTILAFGNIPPLFPVKGKSLLFFQTVLYFKDFQKFIKTLRVKIKITIERIWIRARLHQTDLVFVQSTTVRDRLINEYKYPSNKIELKPFFDLDEISKDKGNHEKNNSFFYPAIGTSHKNHLKLIEAWVLLAKEKIYPTLIVTLDDRYKKTIEALEDARVQYNVRYINLGLISRDEVILQMKKSEVLIFPSCCESFGLPLLEAHKYKMPIIAGELDYVRDVVSPVETFDPMSSLSISRAVKRYLKIDQDLVVLSSLDEFIEKF